MDMIKKNSTPVKTKEDKFREIVTKFRHYNFMQNGSHTP